MENRVRALSFPNLLYFIILVCIIPVVRPCLQCDHRVMLLHEDFLLAAASSSVEEQIELKKIMEHAVVTYKTTSEQMSGGLIDLTTLYRASTEYQSEFDRFQDSQLSGPLTFEAIQILEKGRRILEKHLHTFVQDGLCPNKCGELFQRVMNCLSCQYNLHNCLSTTQDCGEFLVEAAEGGQAVLDCFLPWHRLVVGRPEYHYTWAPGRHSPSNVRYKDTDFRVLVVTEDSSIVLNQLTVDEAGTYRCFLTDAKGTLLSRTYFLLSVTLSPVPTPRSLHTLPTLSNGDDAPPLPQPPTDLLQVIIAVVTALSLTASLCLAMAFRLMSLRQWRREERQQMGMIDI
ncbi:izumo sperm-egg fusion protein 1 [Esox lucius]|uniref:izumo sperm-egg fusion protein 1 n=1 Tax=Esox lucius TaxID=8010 RepID=UPI0009734C53|nr:izumo sperm-egg fusion protein 1 [Esox lucius]